VSQAHQYSNFLLPKKGFQLIFVNYSQSGVRVPQGFCEKFQAVRQIFISVRFFNEKLFQKSLGAPEVFSFQLGVLKQKKVWEQLIYVKWGNDFGWTNFGKKILTNFGRGTNL
jgi:hypothetical protein